MAEFKKKQQMCVYSDKQFMLPPARLQYAPGLWEPSAFDEKAKPKYAAKIFFAKDTDFTNYQTALAQFIQTPEMRVYVTSPGSPEEAKKLAQGYDKSDIIYADSLKKPIKRVVDPIVVEKYPFLEGCFTANPKNANPVPIIDQYKKPIPPEERTNINSGDWVNVLVSLGYMIASSQLFLRLHAVQFAGKGDPIGFSSKADLDQFEAFNDPSMDSFSQVAGDFGL